MIHLARIGELHGVRLKNRLWSVLWGAVPLALLSSARVSANEVAAVRAQGAIVVDGILDEVSWHDAPVLDDFYEIFPGDHSKPGVHTTVRFAWDAENIYVAMEADDPEPETIRRPFVRRDWVRAGQDYLQVYIDALGTRRGSQVFRINARGNLTDGLTNEATGLEDDTPDFPFDVATKLTERGWQAELRIPFSSLRFRNDSDAPWAILAYRGRFRNQNTQIASGPITRDANCWMCFATTVTGIHTPSRQSSLLVTPQIAATGPNLNGSPGLDAKWIPTAGWVIDATINPDFSELEADAPQLTGNVRTVASLPEKRAIFLESLDLLQTPMPYVYTRSVADPELGLRATHRGESIDATAWVARDRAGSAVFLPGPFGAGIRELPETDVALGRARWSGSHLGIALDVADRSGTNYSNRVFGADAAWLPTSSDNVLAQWLASETHDPFAGVVETASGGAWHVEWNHGSARLPWLLRHERIDRDFRADSGYMSGADIEENYAKVGPRFFDLALFNELQTFVEVEDQRVASTGATIDRWVAPGFFFQVPRNGNGTITWHRDESVRAAADLPVRRTNFLRLDAAISPNARWTKFRVFGDVGRLMDFETGEVATGHALGVELRARPHDRLELLTTVTHEALSDEGGSHRTRTRTGEAATLLYYPSTATSWRLEWLHRQAALRTLDQSLSLVFSHRPNWRQSLFAGVSTERRPDHSEWRLFLKWSRTFDQW